MLSAKSIDKFSNSKDIANYFSGIIALNDNQRQISYSYFKSLEDLEESHYRYSQFYLYSLVSLKKFKNAFNYSKELETKKIDNFESNLITAVYHLKNQNFTKAKIYSKKLKNQSKPDTIQNLISTSLYSWSNFIDINDVNLALLSLKSFPARFENMKNIQKVFAYCHFDSKKTDTAFKKLIVNPNINYSRYYFFYSNYLISKKKNQQAKKVLQSSLNLYPKNLILNQLQKNLNQKQKIYDQFDCKKTNHVIAEILYVVANGLSSEGNYIASNFYLNLAKYLNPNFLSFDILYAENFYAIEQYSEAISVYRKIKKKGSNYNWYTSKRTASILKKQEKKKRLLIIYRILF